MLSQHAHMSLPERISRQVSFLYTIAYRVLLNINVLYFLRLHLSYVLADCLHALVEDGLS